MGMLLCSFIDLAACKEEKQDEQKKTLQFSQKVVAPSFSHSTHTLGAAIVASPAPPASSFSLPRSDIPAPTAEVPPAARRSINPKFTLSCAAETRVSSRQMGQVRLPSAFTTIFTVHSAQML